MTTPSPARETAEHPIPADRISELYNGTVATTQASQVARERIHWMCSRVSGDRVIDIGCSQGITAILLAREGFHVTGLDSHPEAIAFAAEATEREGKAVAARLTWDQRDLYEFADKALFDTVILGEVIEHQAAPERFLKAAQRLLKPNGVIVLTTPFGLHPHEDHKVTLLPTDVVRMAEASNLEVTEIEVVDGYIRMTARNLASGAVATPRAVDELLRVTATGALAAQERHYTLMAQRGAVVEARAKEIAKHTATISKHTATIAELKAAADAGTKTRRGLETELAKAGADLARTQSELASARAAEAKALADLAAARIAGEDAAKALQAALLEKTEIAGTLKAAEARSGEIDLALKAAQLRSGELEAALKTAQSQTTEAKAELKAATDRIERLADEQLAARAELFATREALKASEETIVRRSAEQSETQVALAAALAAAQTAEATIVRITAEEAGTSSELAAAQAELQSARAMIERVSAEQSGTLAELAEAQTALQAAEETIDRLSAEQSSTLTELAEAQAALQSSEDACDRLSAEQAGTLTELAEALAAREAAEQTIERLSAEQTATLTKLSQAQAALKSASGKLTRLQADTGVLREAHNALTIELEETQQCVLGLRDSIARQDADHLRAKHKFELVKKRLTGDLSELKRQLGRRASRLAEAEAEAARERRRAMISERAQHRALATYERQATALKQSIAYQLGMILLQSFKSFENFLRMPGQLLALRREHTQRRRLMGNQIVPELGGKDFSTLLARLKSDGFAAACAMIDALALPGPTRANAYTVLARTLQGKDPAACARAATLAEEADPHPWRAKWLAFRRYDAGDLVEPARVLRELAGEIAFSASEDTRAAQIEALADLFEIKPLLPYVGKASYTPKTGSMLYVAASALPYHVSGYSVRTGALLTALREAGVELTVATRPGYPWDRNDSTQPARTSTSEFGGITYHHFRQPAQDMPIDVYIERAAAAIARLAREKKVAVIHAASNHVNALPALMAARQLGIPFHFEMRGLWEMSRASNVEGFEESERYRLGLDLERFIATHANQVYAISQPLAQFLRQEWRIEAAKIAVLPNGIDSAVFTALAARPADRFTIGYAGALVPYEGLDLLLDAVAQLRAGGADIALKLIGDGTAREALEARVRTLRLENAVEFLGKLTPEMARARIAACSLVCLPRRPDRVCELVPPIKLVETMAIGVPVVLPDLPAFRAEAEDGVTALFFRAGDSSDLARAIAQVQADPAAAAARASEARRRTLAERDWRQAAEAVIASAVFTKAAPSAKKAKRAEAAAQDDADLAERAIISDGSGASQDVEAPEAAESLATPEGIAATETPDPDGAAKPVLAEGLADEPTDDSLAALLADPDRLSKLFEAEGIAPFVRQIDAKSGLSKAERVREMLNVGGALTDAGLGAAEALLVEEALRTDRSPMALMWAYRTYERLGDFEKTRPLLIELESHPALTGSAAEKARIEKLKGGLANQLEVLKLIEARRERAFEPVGNRICYMLHNSLPYSSGGYATRSHGVASGLRDAGFDVTVMTRPGYPQDIVTGLEEQVVPEIDEIDGIPYRRTFEPPRRSMKFVHYVPEAARVLEEQYRKLRPALVISASNHVVALPALIACRRLGIPFVYEVRGFWEVTKMSREEDYGESAAYKLQSLLEAAACNEADHVFTLTEPMREELIERSVPASKIDLLPNSCDPTRFEPCAPDKALAAELGIPDGVPVIGYVGTFVDYEGLEDLAKACGLLKQRGHQFRLLLVGNENTSGTEMGPITTMIAEAAAESGFSDWLMMPGRVSHEVVHSYYSLLDICPFPRKPWPVCEMVSPMKPLEALAMEKLVIVSSVRALVEMIADDRTGMVFTKGDISSLADTLERAMASPELRTRLGKAGRAWVEAERTWKAVGIKAAQLLAPFVTPVAGGFAVPDPSENEPSDIGPAVEEAVQVK